MSPNTIKLLATLAASVLAPVGAMLAVEDHSTLAMRLTAVVCTGLAAGITGWVHGTPPGTAAKMEAARASVPPEAGLQ